MNEKERLKLSPAEQLLLVEIRNLRDDNKKLEKDTKDISRDIHTIMISNVKNENSINAIDLKLENHLKWHCDEIECKKETKKILLQPVVKFFFGGGFIAFIIYSYNAIVKFIAHKID